MGSRDVEAFLGVLQERFERHSARHPELRWLEVRARLEAHPTSIRPLIAMEETGGEPDVVGGAGPGGELTFIDCSPESPSGRRSLCYDEAALESRKTAKPAGSAKGMARSMGIEILSEEAYRKLQRQGPFDLKTSSWLDTPEEVRSLGGAIFGDFRFGRIFVYHNGAESYYAARGFRGMLRV